MDFLILGYGGSFGFAVPAKKFSFAYVVNQINTEASTDIDARYKSMLIQIGTMLNEAEPNRTRTIPENVVEPNRTRTGKTRFDSVSDAKTACILEAYSVMNAENLS